MSNPNLDRSLDEILSGSARPARGNRRGGEKSAPGGIRKRPQRAAAAKATAAVTTLKSTSSGSEQGSKIIVSNLPYDITENQIKEYFTKVVGPIRKCTLVYGPEGKSRGVATIVFQKPGDGKKAFESHNGVLVDKRPMKVELVVEAKAPGLEDRIGPINNKPAPAPKKAKPAPATSTRGRGQGARRGRGAKPAGRKPKTAEELDAEMADYFNDVSGAPATTGTEAAPAPQPANGGDANMDEVL
ncbi:RNA-binding domain-containing protein [Ascobolus immersus RN42]|uniref:RNA-binding domain-containing protein n=1 Tax=Ascobolus immersus RN42 TaxID=1160509 RepID=A0A3N4IUV8_ASCIM|nr:RNA-binding domain-containing protein [Ascobolus immersus RN42]